MIGGKVARGNLTGTLSQRRDNRPGLRGAITIETDLTLRAGDHLYLAGWVRDAGLAGATFVSIVVEQGEGGGRLRSKPTSTSTEEKSTP